MDQYQASLRVILEYLDDTEREHYACHLMEGQNPQEHVYWHVKKIREHINKESTAPSA